jgi:hypothetical protein
MEFLATHWHCILPLIGLAAYFLCTARDNSKPKDEDWDSR